MTLVSEIVVMAVGGNALAPSGLGSIDEQAALARQVATAVVGLIEQGVRVLVVHGNGPQVGALAMAQEGMAQYAPMQPLHVLSAMTQGQLGWLLATTIGDAMEHQGMPRHVAALMTQVVVDVDDPGFQSPTKPIGPFFSKGRAHRLGEARGWAVAEDSGRGWRRVVPSPLPREVVEADEIVALLESHHAVIACGGGGVPVIRQGASLHGIEAVIDKDLVAALVGTLVDADTLLLLTGVDRVAINFGTPDEQPLEQMTAAQARGHLADGQFPAGSMGPKVEAALGFIAGEAGRSAIIASLENAAAALAGTSGTRIVP